MDARKIMFFDIDGTLMDESSEHVKPESTLRALSLARAAGNLLFINTGRPRSVVGDDVREMGFDGFVCGCGTNIEIYGREVFYHTVEPTVCADTVRLVRECDATPMYERRDGVFFDPLTRDLALEDEEKEGFVITATDTRGCGRWQIWQRSFVPKGLSVSRTVDDVDFGFDKFVICYDERTDLARFKRGIEGRFDFIDRGWGFAELVPCGFSKGGGIDAVIDACGIDLSRSYAIGDSLNDLPMKGHVGTFICMGNGEKLKPYADYVTDDIHADGLYNAMKHFGFFRA